MPSPFFPALAALVPAQIARRAPGAHSLWEWIEEHGGVVYPVMAVLIVGLIVSALLASWKSDELDAEKKSEMKVKILQLLRRRISGVSAEVVAAELQVDRMLAARLLSELEEEGLVSPSASAAPNIPVQYRIRGRT